MIYNKWNENSFYIVVKKGMVLRMNNMKKCNYVISIITAILGLGIMFMAKKYSIELTTDGPGAGFWPFLLGAILTAVSVILFIVTIVNKAKLEAIPVILSTPANIRVYIMMGVVIGFCVLIQVLGFYIAALIFVPITMLLLDVRNKKTIIFTTIILVVAVYVIFQILLKTTLPQPFFME